MAGEVQLSYTLARPEVVAMRLQQIAYVQIEIMPTQLVAQMRMPLNVSFVLDCSGSMEGDSIACVREAANLAFDLLGPLDSVSVVSFAHHAQVLVPTQSATNLQAARTQVRQLTAEGGTKISLGMELALKELARGQSGALKRMILLTDGQTDKDEATCLRQADQARRQEVQVTALGLGDDWDEQLLQEIVDRAGGKADYINHPQGVQAFFQQDIASAQRAAIQNAVLNLRLLPDCTPRAVWQVIPLIKNLGYRPIGSRDISVPLGELETGQGQTLLVELLVPSRPAGQFRIGQLEVRYDVPQLKRVAEHVRQDIVLTFVADGTADLRVEPRVMNIVEKVSAFRLQTQALEDVEQGNVGAATQKLRSAVTQLLHQGEPELAQTVQQEIHNLERQGQISQAGSKTMRLTSRKTVRLSDLNPPDAAS